MAAILYGDSCPAEQFLSKGEAATEASRNGLLEFLKHVSKSGWDVPSAWYHEVNKEHHIFEFTKGPLRLFFFRGAGTQIVVCTVGGRKKGRKVDQSFVRLSIQWRQRYFAAVENQTLVVINDGT